MKKPIMRPFLIEEFFIYIVVPFLLFILITLKTVGTNGRVEENLKGRSKTLFSE